jgi:hypothetical protein
MDKGDTLALLQKKLGRVRDEDSAIKLLQTLNYMPLAIAQAVTFIKQRAPRMSISRYLEEVCRSDRPMHPDTS